MQVFLPKRFERRTSVDSGNFTLRNYVMVESNACGDTKFCPSLYMRYWGVYKKKK